MAHSKFIEERERVRIMYLSSKIRKGRDRDRERDSSHKRGIKNIREREKKGIVKLMKEK